MLATILIVASVLADEPSPEALKQEVAALQVQLAAVHAIQDVKLSILSQTVSACFAAMDRMAVPPAKTVSSPSKAEEKHDPRTTNP